MYQWFATLLTFLLKEHRSTWKMKSSHVRCLHFAKSFHMLHKLQISEWSQKQTWKWELSSAFYGEENKLREIYLLQITKFYLFYPILQENIPIYQLQKKKKKQKISEKGLPRSWSLSCYSLQSCLTLCDPMHQSPSGSLVHGIL